MRKVRHEDAASRGRTTGSSCQAWCTEHILPVVRPTRYPTAIQYPTARYPTQYFRIRVSVSVSVETRRSDDLYPESSPDGDEDRGGGREVASVGRRWWNWKEGDGVRPIRIRVLYSVHCRCEQWCFEMGLRMSLIYVSEVIIKASTHTHSLYWPPRRHAACADLPRRDHADM